jgi:hypothetical protein
MVGMEPKEKKITTERTEKKIFSKNPRVENTEWEKKIFS